MARVARSAVGNRPAALSPCADIFYPIFRQVHFASRIEANCAAQANLNDGMALSSHLVTATIEPVRFDRIATRLGVSIGRMGTGQRSPPEKDKCSAIPHADLPGVRFSMRWILSCSHG